MKRNERGWPGALIRRAATLGVVMGVLAFAGAAVADDDTKRTTEGGVDAGPADVTARPGAIVGRWWTEGKGAIVEFSRARDGTYLGVLKWGNNPQKDVKNKDPKLRDRQVIGIVLIWHLRYEAGEYVDGYVYNPEDGDTYRMKAQLVSADALKIHGYLGIALFGQSQIWARTTQAKGPPGP
jgi:uncharacterized protein (DUF2147 family)